MQTAWLAISVLGLVPSVEPPATTRPGPGEPVSRVWITGGSNVRRFTCRARDISGTLALHAVPTREPILSGVSLSGAPSLSISVDGIDCSMRAMNRHLRDALGAARHSAVDFRLTSYNVDLAVPAPVTRIQGQGTIGAAVRHVIVAAAVQADSLGRLHVVGSYVHRPTDYGIAPPRRFGGLLRVHDRIVVHFDVIPEADRGAIERLRCSLNPRLSTEPNPGGPDVSP
jgi:hypothetical protein